jgi:hypothetical protein
MRIWLITYTPDKERSESTILEAPSYTMALVEFMRKYPNFEYTGVFEVMK